MPTAILPDGSRRDLPLGSTALDLARSIGEGLAKAAIGARVEGTLMDIGRPLPEGQHEVSIVTAPKIDKGKSKFRDEQHEKDALYLLRHSAAHVMAEAIQRIRPDALLAYGPPLETGFYYDIAIDPPISSDDFSKIEAEMAKIVEENRPFTRYELPTESGLRRLQAEKNRYKTDNALRGVLKQVVAVLDSSSIIDEAIKKKAHEFADALKVALDDPEKYVEKVITFSKQVEPQPQLSWYVTGEPERNWEDLCMGPHVPSTGRIGAFKVTSTASSHWHGDVTSDRFQRIYGTAFFTKADLEDHLQKLDEAKKRDHRVIGPQLGLFAIDDKVGSGLVLWKPKGAVVRQELQNFISGHLTRQGYHQVFTPHIGKLELYRTSGHFPYYADSQFPPLVERETIAKLADERCSCADLANMLAKGEIDGYLLKPMNCPHHIRIYANDQHSYRDLPVRLAEFGTVYRWEQSGELGGMTRVRGFTQDDAHIFCTEEQLDGELGMCLELVKIIFSTLGITDYRVRVGLRDPKSDKFVGDPAQWDAAGQACERAAKTLGVSYTAEPGEAAFYGPKIDFIVKDVIGREWQLGTVQVDYVLPERFGLEYIGPDNQPHRPVIIHRAPFGSMERFIGVLIEHFAGAFPLWLAPVQVAVLPISEKFNEYGQKVAASLRDAGLRTETNLGNEKIGAKIRDATLSKVPYMLICGEKEQEAGTVSVRSRAQGDLGALPLPALAQRLAAEVHERSLPPERQQAPAETALKPQ